LRKRPPPQAVACPDCDLLQKIPRLLPRARATCPRCGCVLAWHPEGPKDLPLALTVAAVIVFIVANTLPLMDLSVIGRSSSTTIAGGAYEMWQQDEELAAVLIAFCAVLAPGDYLLFMLTVLTGSRGALAPKWVGEMLRWASHFRIWSTLDVMMLGILVALVKIAELATVTPGIGMYACGVLIVLLPSIAASFDIRELWQKVEWTDGTVTVEEPGEQPQVERPS
jgi:paraquat-inducible protein A